ncbi:hypothetical protein DCAR_0727988 [Daucus carota subsp. sativus]|uniref:PRA1 family protein n=1 Tax=Daucus carota subsp. sativus TaxID=79200 RepID=A0AAF0XIR0_DAUCS|nr:hypothetical protein DCAR_0727988 [Daucus carota subsp. sativus]
MSTPPPTPSLATLTRPWHDFLDISALSLPLSFSESTFRIRKNLHFFRFNYTLITLIILFFSLIYHPFSIITFLIILAAWLYLYLLRAEPLLLFNWVFDEWIVLIFLCLITFVGLVLTRVWWNVFVACLIGGVVACVHGALRAPEEGDDMESPYGPLLSVVDSPRGGYSPV